MVNLKILKLAMIVLFRKCFDTINFKLFSVMESSIDSELKLIPSSKYIRTLKSRYGARHHLVEDVVRTLKSLLGDDTGLLKQIWRIETSNVKTIS